MESKINQYDIIIIGSGIAAQSFLSEVSDKFRILIIEGGDQKENQKYQSLASNNEYGHLPKNWWGIHSRRVYGGNANVWGGYVLPFEESEFKGYLNTPAWPIGLNDLKDDYKKAAKFHRRNTDIITEYPEPIGDDDLLKRPFSISPRVVIRDPEDDLNQATVDIWFKTNVIRFESQSRKSITGIWVIDEKGQETLLTVHSRQKIILACGGLGNAQILLQPASDNSVPVGNESGLVGKFLMEHPHSDISYMFIDKGLTTGIKQSYGAYEAGFILSEKVRLRESLLACTFLIAKERIDTSQFLVEEGEALLEKGEALYGYQKYFEKKFNKKLVKATGIALSEQEPLFINSVSLVNEKNWAGLFKLRVQCAFSALDLWSIDQSTRIFGEYLYKNKLGILKIDNDGIYHKVSGGGHIMGTTRMGFSAKDSVVDKNCKVHAYDNFYLAGSSVFTSGGACNPTLTISALAIRLARHLSARI